MRRPQVIHPQRDWLRKCYSDLFFCHSCWRTKRTEIVVFLGANFMPSHWIKRWLAYEVIPFTKQDGLTDANVDAVDQCYCFCVPLYSLEVWKARRTYQEGPKTIASRTRWGRCLSNVKTVNTLDAYEETWNSFILQRPAARDRRIERKNMRARAKSVWLVRCFCGEARTSFPKAEDAAHLQHQLTSGMIRHT